MKTGILGGSFDPIHNGHLHMARAALEEFGLDELWLIPAGHSPNKNEANMTSALQRLQMCRLAALGEEKITVSDLEVMASERSYTYRTLQKLTEQYPDRKFYFIMGGDSLDYFDEWCHPEMIASLAVILVIVREGFPVDSLEAKIQQLKRLFPCEIHLALCSRYDISSSKIRSQIHNEELCTQVLKPAVYEYIRENHLYGY